LKRRSKKVLEDSIERVFLVLKEEEDDSESFNGDFDGTEDTEPELKVQCRIAIFMFYLIRAGT
jgi:ribosome biogenesis ATPase